jgi:hypothetical protein
MRCATDAIEAVLVGSQVVILATVPSSATSLPVGCNSLKSGIPSHKLILLSFKPTFQNLGETNRSGICLDYSNLQQYVHIEHIVVKELEFLLPGRHRKSLSISSGSSITLLDADLPVTHYCRTMKP